MLYPKHYVELSLIRHMKDHHREDEIYNIARHMLKGIVEYSEDLPFLNIFPKNLMQFFEHLQHHKKSSNKHSFLDLSKIFGPYQDKDGCNVIPNMIIIEGAPGMGKTTLCKEIAYLWANNQILADSELVLFVSLCNPAVKQMKGLRDLIHLFYNLDTDILEQYLNFNSNKIAIIFDGYDEFSDSCGDSIITKILNTKMLTECKIIITSRHTASYKLLNQGRKDTYVRVEILGFTKESRVQYIKQELGNVSSRVDKLQSYLDTHTSIENMCYIPMMMTILVYIFKEKEELPADSTNLYETLVACTICRFYQKIRSVKRFTSLKDMPKECELYLRSLSNFAFLTLEKYQIVFTEEDIKSLCPRSPLTKAGLDGLGLIKITQYFSIERSDKRAFNFLNLSIQEYLAGYFVNSIDQARQFEKLKDTFFSAQYSHMWKMFIAMSKQKWFRFKHYLLYFNEKDSKTINKWINNFDKMTLVNGFVELINFVCQDKKNIQLFCFKPNEDSNNLFLDLYSEQQKLYLSISSGDDTTNSSLFEIFVFGDEIHEEWLIITDALVTTHNFSVTVVDILGLIGCKAKQKQLISSLRVNNSLWYFMLRSCHITGNAVKSLENCCANSEYLRGVAIDNCYFDKNGLREMVNVLSKKSLLMAINFLNITFMAESIKALASTVRNNVNLQMLKLCNIKFQGGIEKVIYAMENITTLKIISITDINISATVSDRLATALQSNNSLISLNLANNNLKTSAIVILQCVSMIISQLHLLNLEGNYMPKEAGEALKSVILNNLDLEILILNNNNLSDSALKVARALKSLTLLRTLDLGNNNLPGTIMDELSKVFMSAKCLERLTLCNNNLKSSILCVLKSLSTNSKLEYLDIRGNQITAEAGELLASVIQKNTVMNTLLLGNNNIGKGMMQITKALQQITSLKVLDLGKTNIPKETCNGLALAIDSNRQLENISLQDNALGSSVTTILQRLSKLSSLKTLDLQDNQLNDNTAELLASVILNNSVLKSLNLCNNSIRKGALQIAKALQHITSLRLLNLGDNMLIKEVCNELACAFKYNVNIESLCLHDNKLQSSALVILQSLSTITTLKVLNMNNNQIGKKGGDALASIIRSNTGLKELCVGGNNLQRSVVKISKALQTISTIESLDLSNNNLTNEVGIELAAAILSNSSLKHLELQNNNLQSSIGFVLKALNKLSTLESLVLQNNQLTEKHGESLRSVINNNASLETLFLGSNNINLGAVKIAGALQNIKSLKMLDFSNINLSKEVIHKLSTAIKSSNYLELLTIGSNNLQSSAIVILQSLSYVTTLKVLDMNNNHIGEKGGEMLAAVIKNNTRLNELYFSSNNLQNSVIKILEALQTISNLESLDLSNNNLPEGIGIKLAAAIQSNNYLRMLSLHSNNLQSSIVVILQALSELSTLKLLDLHNCHLTSIAAKGLESVIVNNTGLKCLYLNDNNLGKGLINILKALQNVSSLKKFDISNNNFMNDLNVYLTIANKFRAFLENLCQFTGYSDSSGILKQLCIASKSNTNVFLAEQAERALTSVLQNNPRLEALHVDSSCINLAPNEVIKALNYINCIKVLSLNNLVMSREMVNELAFAIKLYTCLENIYLNGNNLKSSVIILSEALRTISTLKVLDLQNNELTEDTGDSLASVIANNPLLETLFLDNNNIGVGALKIAKALQNIKSLKMLGLDNNHLPKEIAHELAAVIKSNCYLELLTLSFNDLQSSAIVILQSLSTISTLKFLCIMNNQIGEKGGEVLATVIKSNTGLNELQLGSNNLWNSTIKISEALQTISSLELLDLSNNNLPEGIGIKLAAAIQSNNSIRQLSLRSNNLQSSIVVILQALSELSTLELLDLYNCHLTSIAAKGLKSVIVNNTGLKHLCLNDNNLQKSVIQILEVLQNISSLESLDLMSCSLPKGIGVQLVAAISSNKSLNKLVLRNSNLRSSDLTVTVQALHTLSNINYLDIFDNVITEEVGNVLATVISRNVNLRQLLISLLYSPLCVAEALQSLSNLQTLVFCTCNISHKVEIKIASAITNNKSLTWLSLPNVNMSQNVIIQSIKTISNLKILWLEDNLLSEEMSDELSLAISSNKSLETLILLDNMLQTGLIKIAKACNKLSNIKVLQLAHNCIVPSKVVELTSVIAQNTSLERVLLGGITLNAAECFHLNINEVLCKTDITSDTSCVIFNHCTILEMIYLEMLRKQIDNDKKCFSNHPTYLNAKNFSYIQKIHNYFKHNNITQIKNQIANGKLLQVDAKKMISSLYILEKVKVIDLENNNIDEDASFELSTALHSNNVLEQLWLRGNKLNTAGALYILNSLEYLTTLQVLDFSYNNISSQSADGIAAVIDNNPLLNQLWLDGNDLHSTGTIKICKALKKIRTLSILSLCNNGIADDAADELSAVIAQNVLLEDLLLSNNQLHSTGIELIAESLNKLIKLRKLDLFNNNIGKEGANPLAVGMRNSTSLQDLFLSSNNLETSGALEICNALSHICSLHVLTLSNNNINDEVTSELIEVLNNNHLYALLIGGNGLECGGVKIAQVIENDNIAMQLLDLSDNNISEQDKENIKVVFSKRANFKLYV